MVNSADNRRALVEFVVAIVEDNHGISSEAYQKLLILMGDDPAVLRAVECTEGRFYLKELPDVEREQRLAELKKRLDVVKASSPRRTYIVMQGDYSWKVVDRETYLHPPDSMINNKASVSSEGMTEILVSNLLPPDLLSLQEFIALEKAKLEKHHG